MIEQDVFVNDKSELYPGDAVAAILRAMMVKCYCS